MEREITTKDTIPAGTAGTGTVTTNASYNTMLDVTGGVYSEWNRVTTLEYKNIWIHLIGSYKIAKVVSIIKRSDTSFTLILDVAMPGIVGDTFKIVEGNLVHYSITNDAGAEGDYNGVQFIVGKTFTSDRDYRLGDKPKPAEVVKVDGTGTTLVCSETR